jgi:hypothetical protein
MLRVQLARENALKQKKYGVIEVKKNLAANFINKAKEEKAVQES